MITRPLEHTGKSRHLQKAGEREEPRRTWIGMPGQRAKRTPKLESGDHNAAGSLQGTSGRDMPCTFALHPPCLKDQRIGRASKSPARWPRGSAKAFTASTCYSIYPFADLTPLPCASAVVLDRHATMASGTVWHSGTLKPPAERGGPRRLCRLSFGSSSPASRSAEAKTDSSQRRAPPNLANLLRAL